MSPIAQALLALAIACAVVGALMLALNRRRDPNARRRQEAMRKFERRIKP